MEKNTLCPCKRKGCERYGDCEACREHHRNEGKYLPVCERKKQSRKSEEIVTKKETG